MKATIVMRSIDVAKALTLRKSYLIQNFENIKQDFFDEYYNHNEKRMSIFRKRNLTDDYIQQEFDDNDYFNFCKRSLKTQVDEIDDLIRMCQLSDNITINNDLFKELKEFIIL